MAAASLVPLLSEAVLALAVVAVAVLSLRAAVAVALACNQHPALEKHMNKNLNKDIRLAINV